MTRDTLYLINSNLNFKPVHSDRLFYDRWNYCVKFYLAEVSILRDTLEDHEILEALDSRKRWREQARTRWPGLNMAMVHGNIDTDTVNFLLKFAYFLKNNDHDYKMVISVNHAWIYTNDTAFLNKITQLDCVRYPKFTQAVISKPRDCVQLRSPKHQWRSYLRSVRLEPVQKEHLINYLNNQSDIRVSAGMQTWLDSHYARSQDYYFIDHNGKGFETMLSLVLPKIIRRTLPIVAK